MADTRPPLVGLAALVVDVLGGEPKATRDLARIVDRDVATVRDLCTKLQTWGYLVRRGKSGLGTVWGVA